jgi:very-short-patch-repair endonuclease
MAQRRGVVNEVPIRLRSFAKEQRSMLARAEALFWQQVRAGRLHGHKFKRQVPVSPYIVDFLCIAAKVIVELDGPPHNTPDRRVRDADRDTWLRNQGFIVLRFSNDLVLGNCQTVLDAVLAAIEARLAPSPAPRRGTPSPAKGERGTRTIA